MVRNIRTFGMWSRSSSGRGGKEIGRKKGGLVEETALADGEKAGVFSLTARRLELLGASLAVRGSGRRLESSAPGAGPARPVTLLREIFLRIASSRSCFRPGGRPVIPGRLDWAGSWSADCIA
jgi:hypothetical protein